MNKYGVSVLFTLSFVAVVLLALVLFFGMRPKTTEQSFLKYGLQTNTEKTAIDLEGVLSGGPGKDGIPAISVPKFVSIAESEEDDQFYGIVVDLEDEQRFYPYSVLVWHEIVNDSIGDAYFAVSFCPLCGTGIVYDRKVGGEVLEFGVSGLLRESNLLMYDTATESLWSQSLGEAVVGDYLGETLGVLPFQLITFAELKEKYPNARVMSRDTGFPRQYGVYPYGDYEENDTLVFPVSFKDEMFPLKEPMYVVPFEGRYYAMPYAGIPEGESVFSDEGIFFAVSRDGDEIVVAKDGRRVPGYFEVWFSFNTHHQDDGVVLHARL